MTILISRSGLQSTVIDSGTTKFVNIKIRLSAGDSITYTKDSANTNDVYANSTEYNNP